MSSDAQALENRVIRYNELVACKNAFIDTKTPGSDKKENFCLIGPGVSERADQHVHIVEPHGFNIGGARQPKGCVNSQHSHLTAETFVVHEGDWKFTWGHDSSDGEAVLSPGDTISIPVNVFRGFEYVGEGKGFLFAVLGEDDPGFVTWAPYVFEQAKDHGLVLLEDGGLIDTSLGETIPEGAKAVTPTSMEDVKSYRSMSVDEMLDCVSFSREQVAVGQTEISKNSQGVEEVAIIGADNPKEGLPAGKMSWSHGYQLRRWNVSAGGAIPAHKRFEEEVLFVQQGSLKVKNGVDDVTLTKGDTMTVPIEMPRSFTNESAEDAIIYVVRKGDSPKAIKWL